MKKILFITLSLAGGGAERVVSVLASELAERDYPVLVVVYDRKVSEYKTSPKLKILELQRPKGSNKLTRIQNRIREIRQLVKTEKPDIVIPFLALPTLHTWIATRGLGCKLYATVRNNPKEYPTQVVLRAICNYITRKSDGIILQTKEQETFFGSSKEKCFVIPNPVKQEMLDAEKDYAETIKTIITCGRLNKQKNHALLVRAVSNLIDEGKQLKLLIYGEGSEQKELQNLIDELHMNHSAHLMGRTNQVRDALLNADMFVLSSDYEGLPNALMEAMAVGLPCISTACPTGPSDLIQNGKNGILMPVQDETALSDAIMYAIENVDEMTEMGKKAKIAMMNYSLKNVVDSLITYING